MSDIRKKGFMQLFIDAIELYPEKMDDGRIIRQIDLAFPCIMKVLKAKQFGCSRKHSRDGMFIVQTP